MTKRVQFLAKSVVNDGLVGAGTILTVPDEFVCGPNAVVLPDEPAPEPLPEPNPEPNPNPEPVLNPEPTPTADPVDPPKA